MLKIYTKRGETHHLEINGSLPEIVADYMCVGLAITEALKENNKEIAKKFVEWVWDKDNEKLFKKATEEDGEDEEDSDSDGEEMKDSIKKQLEELKNTLKEFADAMQ